MIIITGAAGFIGSEIAVALNEKGRKDLILVDELEDDLGNCLKSKNLNRINYQQYEHKTSFINRIKKNQITEKIEAIIHMGACSSTRERNWNFLKENNTEYSQILASWCLEHDARYIYASSAATYGEGENGFEDNENKIETLVPINLYAKSKQLMDIWVKENGYLDKMVGLKFFNVYGPGECHKEDMRSVARKAYIEIKKSQKISLFKSYRPDYKDGDQKRDFVYVKDCAAIVLWFLEHPQINGIYNVGAGKARSWNAMAHALFDHMDLPRHIDYVDMPEDLRTQYQYFTEAPMGKVKAAGYKTPMTELEEGIKDYIGYLNKL